MPLVVLPETYPGLRRGCVNRASSRLRLSTNSCFVEGWGLYCEEMMWDQGYFLDPRARLISCAICCSAPAAR
jgi:hypothetical protein